MHLENGSQLIVIHIVSFNPWSCSSLEYHPMQIWYLGKKRKKRKKAPRAFLILYVDDIEVFTYRLHIHDAGETISMRGHTPRFNRPNNRAKNESARRR